LRRVEVSLVERGNQIPDNLPAQVQLLEIYTCMAIYQLFRQCYAQAHIYMEQGASVIKVMDKATIVADLSKHTFSDLHTESATYTDARCASEEALGAISQLLFFDRSAVIALGSPPVIDDEVEVLFKSLEVSTVR
jgi:hypothetical protein